MEISQRRIDALRAMAQGGTEHEKRIAQSILSRLNIEATASEVLEYFEFRIANDYEEKLFIQIAGMVFETYQPCTYSRKRRTKIKAVHCTKRERDEIDLFYEAYRRELKKELDVTVEAFIQNNTIFPSYQIKNPQPRELTDAERKTLVRASEMDKVHVRKRIEAMKE